METDAFQLLADLSAAHPAGYPSLIIQLEHLLAPHVPARLPSGKGAVYVFSLSAQFGAHSLAGAHRVLKVGKVGPNSNNRFQYQHHSATAAVSTLAASLLRNPVLWPCLGDLDIASDSVGEWMKQHLDRDHFFTAGEDRDLRSMLEVYLRARLGPVFEGS